MLGTSGDHVGPRGKGLGIVIPWAELGRGDLSGDHQPFSEILRALSTEKDTEKVLSTVSTFQSLQTFVVTWDKDLATSVPLLSG